MTAKYDAFKAALQALCVEHGVVLSTSGYDTVVVSDAEDGDEPVYLDHIEDRTKP